MTPTDQGRVADEWVKYSALLDIWQDEEEPADLLAFGAKLGLYEEDLSQFVRWLPSGRNAEPPTHDGAARGVSRFFALKRLRVWAILRFDRTCYNLANDVAKQGSWANLVAVREAKAEGRRSCTRCSWSVLQNYACPRPLPPTRQPPSSAPFGTRSYARLHLTSRQSAW